MQRFYDSMHSRHMIFLKGETSTQTSCFPPMVLHIQFWKNFPLTSFLFWALSILLVLDAAKMSDQLL